MSDMGRRSRAFDVGRVVNRTFGVLAANGAAFAILGVALYAVPQMGAAWLMYQTWGPTLYPDVTTGTPEVWGIFVLVALGSVIFAVISQTLLQGAAIHLAVEDLKGRNAGVGDAFGVALRNLLPLIGLGILQTIATMFGIFLLILPGVLMMLAWAVTVPSLVVEKTGVLGAFGRSRDLTRDHRGSIFLLGLVFVVATAIVVGIIQSLITAAIAGATGAEQGLLWTTIFVEPVISAITAVIGAVGVGALYFELRWLKSSNDVAEDLAAIFD